MTTLIMLIAVLPVALFVLWPLLAQQSSEGESAAAPQSRLEHQKQEAYAAIKEADFDRRMGKLSNEDFDMLERRHRGKALAAIAALASEDGKAHGEERRRERSPAAVAFCPACGAKLPAGASFCGACGQSLQESAGNEQRAKAP